MTHTYAHLGVSRSALAEIRAKLQAAGYDAQIHDAGALVDMHGIALVEEKAPTGCVKSTEWNRVPPTHVSYQTHKFSVMDSIATAETSLCAHPLDEQVYLVCSSKWKELLTTLPQYTRREIVAVSHRSGDEKEVWHIGDINEKMLLYTYDVPADEMRVCVQSKSAVVAKLHNRVRLVPSMRACVKVVMVEKDEA